MQTRTTAQGAIVVDTVPLDRRAHGILAFLRRTAHALTGRHGTLEFSRAPQRLQPQRLAAVTLVDLDEDQDMDDDFEDRDDSGGCQSRGRIRLFKPETRVS